MLLSAESLYAKLSFYSHERHHSKTGPIEAPLSASLAQAKSWTTTACLMKNHLCSMDQCAAFIASLG